MKASKKKGKITNNRNIKHVTDEKKKITHTHTLAENQIDQK